MSTLYIRHTDTAAEYVLAEDGLPVRYEREEADGRAACEDIYLAVVDRVMPGIGTAFVRLTKEINGCFPLNDRNRHLAVSGKRIPVQVKKEAHGEKLASVSDELTFAGTYAVLIPGSVKISVSQRISDADERKRLEITAAGLCPAGCGLIMRSDAAGAEEETIASEIAVLYEKSERIQNAARSVSAPCLLEMRPPVSEVIFREENGIEKAVSDREERLPCPVVFSASPFSLINAEDRLLKSFRRNIFLPCGGYITVDICEALTVIDVNSGKYAGKKSGKENSFLTVNREAARECARILRLRNIGGNVIIDFIDMQSEASKNEVIRVMSEALSRDPVKTVIHGFTSLGLLELSRKRTGNMVSLPYIKETPHESDHQDPGE